MPSVLFERLRVSNGGHRVKTSLSVKLLKGDMRSTERIAASFFLSFLNGTHRCELRLAAQMAEIFPVTVEIFLGVG